jgi:hypothetical protein
VKVVAKPFQTQITFPTAAEITRIQHQFGKLDIFLESLATDDALHIVFADAFGFRVLNERDLLNFWPVCSSPNGWIYEITSGGWLQQEMQREGFGCAEELNARNSCREYFVVRLLDCVNIISREPPMLRKCPKSTAVCDG